MPKALGSADQAVQQVQNMRLRWRAGLQRQFDGGEHGLLVVLEKPRPQKPFRPSSGWIICLSQRTSIDVGDVVRHFDLF
jgi:hypothetical protein